MLFVFLILYCLPYIQKIGIFFIINIWVLILGYLLPIILIIALMTLLERKLLGSIQRRQGPNKVGIWGLLQPIADALKLIFKETLIPGIANIYLFISSPILLFTISLINWVLIPLDYGIVYCDTNLGLLIVNAIASTGVFWIIISGWASNSKYALLGAVRAGAQMISYEVSLSIVLLILCIFPGTLNITTIIEIQYFCDWFIFWFLPEFILFFILALAETNRVPFDLPEAESELVSGYNVEYSSIMFAFFFLAEYSSILIMCTLIVIFFLGGFYLFIFSSWVIFFIKFNLIIYLFILIRGTVPRYRYDQLMNLGWKILLPLALALYWVNYLLYFFF